MEQQPSPPMGESEFPSASSSLADLAAQVEQHLVDLMKQQSLAPGIAPEGFWDNVQAFRSAVDWSESWIRGVIAFHVLYLVAILASLHSFRIQVSLFLLGCVLVKASESANGYLEAHWQDFSGQNYFDENGLFIACIWAGPLLVMLMLQTFNFLRMNVNLLIKVKRRQLLESIKQRKERADKEE